MHMAIKKMKAQAALEFLTTYGWAFLVILIMMGTLAYFGILSPSKILPNRCTFGSEFQCLDYQIAGGSTNTFKMRLKNNAGDAIDVSSMALASESATQFACSTPPANPVSWKPSQIIDLTWSGCNSAASGFAVDEKGKVLVIIKYNSQISGPAYTKEVKGEVLSTVTS